jgi:hypothetical protein
VVAAVAFGLAALVVAALPAATQSILFAVFADPSQRLAGRTRKNYAGTSPITRSSGKKRVVLARDARNRRMADALQQWAFCSLCGSPGARAYYDTLRDRNIGHQAPVRQVSNGLVGFLHGCLKTHTTYDEQAAWAHHNTAAT